MPHKRYKNLGLRLSSLKVSQKFSMATVRRWAFHALKMAAEPRGMLADLVTQLPEAEMLIDLQTKTLIFANQSFNFDMLESSREAFLSGRFDPLDELLVAKSKIAEVAARLGNVSMSR
jgi:hypothetical protein